MSFLRILNKIIKSNKMTFILFNKIKNFLKNLWTFVNNFNKILAFNKRTKFLFK
jgi:hypothetical protein